MSDLAINILNEIHYDLLYEDGAPGTKSEARGLLTAVGGAKGAVKGAIQGGLIGGGVRAVDTWLSYRDRIIQLKEELKECDSEDCKQAIRAEIKRLRNRKIDRIKQGATIGAGIGGAFGGVSGAIRSANRASDNL
jgi:hypothetical protein